MACPQAVMEQAAQAAPVKKLTVHYCGWGEEWPLGTLADDGAALLFEYSSEALAQGLELSPLHLKLRGPAYGDFPQFQHRLPGLIADSLPDGWGLLQVDFRLPGSTDYTTLLRATRLLTRDEREVRKAYARAVFNVLFHNRDDHPKNFAWRLGRDRRWRLAPAFDLTFSDGPGGQHHMDVCGEGDRVEYHHLLRLASEGGVPERFARETIERVASEAGSFEQRAVDYPIRCTTVRQMSAVIERCRRVAIAGS